MNANDCLPKERHDQRIGCISSREFHVVSELVRRDALQHELTGIRILAFIALQRNTEKPDANSDHEYRDDHCEKNPFGFQNSIAFCGLALHRFFNETHRLQTTMARQTTQKRRALSVPAGKFGRIEIAITAALAIVTFAI